MANEQFVVFAGAYPGVDDAKADFDAIKLMHKEAWIGPYEGSLFTKLEGGKIKVLDTDSSIRAAGAGAGAFVGGVVGLIFPPSILAGAAVGAGAGALAGHFFGSLKRKDIAELGEMLDEGQAGIVFIGVATPELGAQKLMKRAAKVLKKEVDATAEDLKAAIDEAAKL
jgi:uncharacterized membrane protein